jgi:hypothetical protein
MLGFVQMASAEVEHQDSESRTQAGAELEPRAFAQLQPVAQTFSSQLKRSISGAAGSANQSGAGRPTVRESNSG